MNESPKDREVEEIFTGPQTQPAMEIHQQAGNAQTTNMPGTANVDDLSSNQAAKIKAMVKAIDDLRHLGVEHQGLDLPRICVVGDQSAGKSSLIQALSGIKVPRADGCCTRCPMEVNLTNISNTGGRWKCRVLLMIKYAHTEKKTKKASNTDLPGWMGPWQEQPQKELMFAETYDKDEVEILISNAQMAILNPKVAHTTFVTTTRLAVGERSRPSEQEKFSPNVIRLEIEGVEYPCNLSFIDLPGIIALPENKSEGFLVQVVANLSTRYINSKSSVVILTLPMNNDVENSNAFRLVQTNDAEQRTLGVLTKPDLRPPMKPLADWQKKLLGKGNLRLGFGYHAVMMASDSSLPTETVLQNERDYFQSDQWSSIKSTHPDKLGIPALVSSLGHLLASKISEELPDIIIKINSRAATIDQALTEYPARPSIERFQFNLGQLISNFGSGLESLFSGEGRVSWDSRLRAEWELIKDGFRLSLIRSRPSVHFFSAVEDRTYSRLSGEPPTVPSTPKASKIGAKRADTVVIDADDEDDTTHNPKLPQKSTPSKQKSNVTVSVTDPQASQKPFTLEEITEINRSQNPIHLPNQIAPRAIEDMNKRSVAHWHPLAIQVVDKIGHLVANEITVLVCNIFRDYQNTAMAQEVSEAIEEFLRQGLSEQRKQVIKACRIERDYPLTVDKTGLTRETITALDALTKSRRSHRVMLEQAKLNEESAGQGRGKPRVVKEEEIDSQPDPYKTHFEIMAVSFFSTVKELIREIANKWRKTDSPCLLPNRCPALCRQRVPTDPGRALREVQTRPQRCRRGAAGHGRRHPRSP